MSPPGLEKLWPGKGKKHPQEVPRSPQGRGWNLLDQRQGAGGGQHHLRAWKPQSLWTSEKWHLNGDRELGCPMTERYHIYTQDKTIKKLQSRHSPATIRELAEMLLSNLVWVQVHVLMLIIVFGQCFRAFSSVQSLSCVWLFVTPWTAVRQASLSITKSQSLPKLMSIESVIPSNYFILCHPLLLLPSIFPSIRVFSNESALRIRWPKYWSFSFNISPSNEHPGLISFRMDWLDLPAVQGTLKSLLQHHSSKASVLWPSPLFLVQLSHSYLTTGKTIALTRWTFVDKVMSLLFNMLSRLVITFLPRNKRTLVSWLQSPSAVILEHQN